MRKPELLAPAGNIERLKWAIIYGADAVYIGGKNYSLRANANNFSVEEIKEATEFAHKRGKKIYVTANIAFHNEDFIGLKEYLLELDKIGIDALIFSDLSLIPIIKEIKAEFEMHISTQQSTLNHESIKFLKSEGVTRVVLGREVSLEEMKEIKREVDIELEMFIHGSMCASYSGRCVLSNFMTMRDSNRGGCSQICRWDFNLHDEEKTDITSDIPFTMCLKDLSMLKAIPDLVNADISSLKVEGRMRSVYYIATIMDIYRRAIDNYMNDKENYEYSEEDEEVLGRCSNRENAVQNLYEKAGVKEQYYSGRQELTNQDFLAIVREYDKDSKTATIEQRNYFLPGDEVEVFGPGKKPFKITIENLRNEDGNLVDSACHPNEILTIKCDNDLSSYDIFRKVLTKQKN